MSKCLFGLKILFCLADENHRIIEYLRLEGIHKDPGIQNLIELCEAWCSNFFPGKPAPGADHPLSEEPFPNVQSEPLLRELIYDKVM